MKQYVKQSDHPKFFILKSKEMEICHLQNNVLICEPNQEPCHVH